MIITCLSAYFIYFFWYTAALRSKVNESHPLLFWMRFKPLCSTPAYWFVLFCLSAEWPLSVYPFDLHVCLDGIIWTQAAPPRCFRYCDMTDPWARGRSKRREQRVLLRHLMPWNVLGETRKGLFHIGHNRNHAAWVNFGEDTCWTSALSSFRGLRKCSTDGPCIVYRSPLDTAIRQLVSTLI